MQSIAALLTLSMLTLTVCVPSEPVDPVLSKPDSVQVASVTPPMEQVTEGESTTMTSDVSRIQLSFSGREIVAVLENNPSTQSLLSQLPATVTFSDFAGAEKITYLPQNLSTGGAMSGYDPALGDIACYGPWENMAIYYADQPYAAGLIRMGRVESGIEHLTELTDDVEVVISRVEAKVEQA